MPFESQSDKKRVATPFTGSELARLLAACDEMRDTQLGALTHSFTADELRLLFCPHEHRRALTHVYALEDESGAYGEIYLSMGAITMPNLELFPDDRTARAIFQRATMRLYWRRQFLPDGFITPTPVFGTATRPILNIQDCPPLLARQFYDIANQLLYTSAEWAFIKWTLDELQRSLRSPEQVRYVWPAIHTLSKVAELEMDLSQPSARAGMNARPSSAVAGYLRATNDVVSNAVLLGVKNDLIQRWKRNDIQVSASYGTLGNMVVSV